ncbi:MAG TPA: low-specificity L-threonine aldolase [Anaerolineales bacterium]|nr:low-specificity L-threonine aldolase [Anaerolineales bacterium]
MNKIDLRSDTVTLPTPNMRRAMAAAEVGDDVYGEDPTVNRLQQMAADMLGHEAGLFVASGTMGNLLAFLAHCQRGDEVIMGDQAHTFLYEAGGLSVLGGVHSRQIANQPDGTLKLTAVAEAIRDASDPHQPITRLISIENTQNHCGGVALTPDYTRSIADLAHHRGLLLHIDGARLFNAAAALNVAPAELAAPADSVTFCLSKGLCAPVGSILCGPADFIARAHRARKLVGGGMRQAGFIAAAGIVALEEIVPRLGEDHERARCLAQGLQQIEGIVLDSGSPASNMIYLNLTEDARTLAERLAEQDILVDVEGPRRFRLVTHYWIDDRAVERTIAAFSQAMIAPAAK